MPDPVKKTVVKRKNRVTSVKNADGTTTKTRVRRDGSTKKVKTYKGNKTVASKVVKYRKDGTKKKVVTRPGDKTGTRVQKYTKKGTPDARPSQSYNKKTNLKKVGNSLKEVGKGALMIGAAASTGLLAPAVQLVGAGMAIGTGGFAAKGVANTVKSGINALKKAKPGKAVRKAGNWAMKGVRNKIQTGNRKGRSKR